MLIRNLTMKHKLLLFLHNIGLCMIPFDRRAYVNEVFDPYDISNVETDPIAIQLKTLTIRTSVDNAENSYVLQFTNRRMLLIAALSVVVSVITVIASCIGLVVAHQDSESTTAALVEAIKSLNNVDQR